MQNSKECIERARANVRDLDLPGLIAAGFLPRGGEYYPSIHYPPKTMYMEMGEGPFFDGIDGPSGNPIVAYVHIPFCLNRCHFCHFVMQTKRDPSLEARYVAAIAKEFGLWAARLGLRKIPVESVCIGGGTATCLTPENLEGLLSGLEAVLELESCRQFTIDTDPSTLLAEDGARRLSILKAHGVDRIVIGAQSFDDSILKRMNRAHTSDEAAAAVRAVRAAGFGDVSLDLIYGLPGQTLETWIDTVRTALSLSPDSMEMYRLRIVPTALQPGVIRDWASKKPEEFPDFERVMTMKEAGRLLAQDAQRDDKEQARLFYKTKENISVYTDLRCCRLSDTIGVGVSAITTLQDRLGINVCSDAEDYCERVERGQIPIARGKVRTRDEELRRRVVGPLKNRAEVGKEHFAESMGARLEDVFAAEIAALKRFDLLEESADRIALTRKGRFFADETCLQFYHPEYAPFPPASYADGPLNPHRKEKTAKHACA
ncbi:MAG: coproporphyrinogen III oxidase family protein [Elusimicrobia bacterium]|nr:coproporphyrinogen III oxidase family protein [Elusimicrobiota bacterium]